ncbi:MAG: hypothetical protein U5R31_00920 [Acidimicrobiia bacterium]|nr:hypothetical protein [Acidimicrobiia bacterium]
MRELAVHRSAGELEDADVCVASVAGSTPTAFSSDHTTESGTDPCFDDSAAGESGMRVQVTSTADATIETGFWAMDVTLEADAAAKHETAPA